MGCPTLENSEEESCSHEDVSRQATTEPSSGVTDGGFGGVTYAFPTECDDGNCNRDNSFLTDTTQSEDCSKVSRASSSSASSTSSPPATPERPQQVMRKARDLRQTDLTHFSASVDLDALVSGDFTLVRQLHNAIHGTIALYRWSRGENRTEHVVVKKMLNEKVGQNKGKETSEWSFQCNPRNTPLAEDALTEIGVLSYLSKQPDQPVYLLRMLGAFADSSSTWLVTEYAEGGDLFAIASARMPLIETQIRSYMWQLLQALSYLHSHHIGHRDVSLENILLKAGVIRLMDFGMAVQSHSEHGEPLRYFRSVGKDVYRAPECYLPEGTSKVQVTVPPGAQPGDVVMTSVGPTGPVCEVRLLQDAVPGQRCEADLWGYAVPPVDVFASGVCLFSLRWHIAPWRHCSLGGAYGEDPSFSFVRANRDCGIKKLLQRWRKPVLSPAAMEVLVGMLRVEPSQRFDIRTCLDCSWFKPIANTRVPVHAPQVA